MTSSQWTAPADHDFFSLVQFLVSSGSNVNAVCSHSPLAWPPGAGTAMDIFATRLLDSRVKGPRVGLWLPARSFDSGEIAFAMYKVLSNEGGEFSRPVETADRFGYRRFKDEISLVQVFPEQLERTSYCGECDCEGMLMSE